MNDKDAKFYGYNNIEEMRNQPNKLKELQAENALLTEVVASYVDKLKEMDERIDNLET